MAAQYRLPVVLSLAIATIVGCTTATVSPVTNSSGGTATGGSAASGGIISIISTAPTGGNGGSATTAANPCLGPNPPSNCHMVPSGPACGDGKINQPSEECDDDNSVPGDGCNGICKVEPNFTCPTPSQPCIPTFKCGNGKIEPGEVCDDGNTFPTMAAARIAQYKARATSVPRPANPARGSTSAGTNASRVTRTATMATLCQATAATENCHQETGWLCLVPGNPCSRSMSVGTGSRARSGRSIATTATPRAATVVRPIASPWSRDSNVPRRASPA